MISQKDRKSIASYMHFVSVNKRVSLFKWAIKNIIEESVQSIKTINIKKISIDVRDVNNGIAIHNAINESDDVSTVNNDFISNARGCFEEAIKAVKDAKLGDRVFVRITMTDFFNKEHVRAYLFTRLKDEKYVHETRGECYKHYINVSEIRQRYINAYATHFDISNVVENIMSSFLDETTFASIKPILSDMVTDNKEKKDVKDDTFKFLFLLSRVSSYYSKDVNEETKVLMIRLPGLGKPNIIVTRDLKLVVFVNNLTSDDDKNISIELDLNETIDPNE